jgi:dipeptidyl aminopeptidase/acylaminoacyl peptidase
MSPTSYQLLHPAVWISNITPFNMAFQTQIRIFACMKLLQCLLFLLLLASLPLHAQTGYKTPPADVAALVDAPAAPQTVLSPDGAWLLVAAQPGVPRIADLAAPELRLAGYRINPANHNTSRSGYVTGLSLVETSTAAIRPVSGLPPQPRIQNLSFSPDGRLIAFTHDSGSRLDLWVLTIRNGRAAKLGSLAVNNTLPGLPYTWFPDSRSLLVRAVRANAGAAPVRNPVPDGPVIQASSGDAAPVRTYQDLLNDAHDEALFRYYTTSRLMRVDLNGRATAIGEPGIYSQVSVSPDGRHILTTRILEPFAYTVPASLFPSRTEVWDATGNRVFLVTENPLLDRIPIAFNSTYEGRRSIQWRRDAPSTLFWVEAADGGDPRRSADIRDRAYLLASPFTREPILVAELATRFAGIAWGDAQTALISETWRATRRVKTWRLSPDQHAQPRLLIDRNYEDRYNDPGSPIVRDGHLRITDGRYLHMTGAGGSPEGDRPFLDRYDLETGETVRLWRSEAPWYESVVGIADEGVTAVITRRETVDVPANLFRRNLVDGTLTALTDIPHPTPQYKGVRTEFITFQRVDGVGLSGQLLLPDGYTPDQGTLPVVVWAYPREFGSADAAGQVTDSPFRFNAISYWGPQFFVTQGYAVLNNAAMPIVAAEPGAEPNDTFVEQLVANAQAAIDELVRRGVSDGKRLAVGGHSYGAFMTANLLAHSDLFRAGIARSGAYNRSLTPFGFQAEPRDLWAAPETYIRMSPFFHADRINEPILLIHGEADNNSGTFPIQSERMYQALKGKGATARLVMLPHESHGYRARESLHHMLWEQLTWLDTYVK